MDSTARAMRYIKGIQVYGKIHKDKLFYSFLLLK